MVAVMLGLRLMIPEKGRTMTFLLRVSQVPMILWPGFEFQKLKTENYFVSWTTDQASTSGAPTNFSSGSQMNINFELERLSMELKHMQGLYAVAQNKVIDASHKLNYLQKFQLVEAITLKEISIKEEEAKQIATQEKEKYEAAKREADYAKECAEKEAEHRKQAESIAFREAKEREA